MHVSVASTAQGSAQGLIHHLRLAGQAYLACTGYYHTWTVPHAYGAYTSYISKTIQFVQKYGLDLATVGGGHSIAGTGSTQGGVLINLSRMRRVTVDPTNRAVIAQGGALWEDVDRAAAEHGLATVGGVINHTGVGGLTLGGGYGWLSGQYGLVVDNLLSVTLVAADGRILTASVDENPDLFWAIRGAGHNFGVVTEFKIQAFEQKNEVYAGLLAFTPDELERVIEFSNTLCNNPPHRCPTRCPTRCSTGAQAYTAGEA
jgi:FAD/FMN-containing dehydrogenase